MKSVWRGRGGGRVARREGSSRCEIYADVFESVPFSRVFFNPPSFSSFFSSPHRRSRLRVERCGMVI